MSATKCIAALGSRSTIAGWVAISLSPESTVALDRECVAVSNIQQRWDLTAAPSDATQISPPWKRPCSHALARSTPSNRVIVAK